MKNIYLLPTNSQLQNIYITSDEEIKKEDYVICWESNYENIEIIKIDKSNYTHWLIGAENYKKIILTTDPDLIADGVQAIDDEFLQWFVKNSSCEYVEVNHFGTCCGNQLVTQCINCEKYNPKYKIIIPQEKPKKEYTYVGECTGNDGNGCFMDSPGHDCGCFIRVPKENNKQETIEETKQPSNFYEELKKHFENTPREKLLEEWEKSAEFDKVGPTVEEFINHSKQETVGEAVERIAKLMQERMYNEEDIMDAWEMGAREGLPLTRKKKENLFEQFKNKK